MVSFISADIALARYCHRGSLRGKEDEKSECHPSACMCRSPLGHSVLSHGPVYSGTRTKYFYYYNNLIQFEIGHLMPPALFFILRIALAIQGILWFRINSLTH